MRSWNVEEHVLILFAQFAKSRQVGYYLSFIEVQDKSVAWKQEQGEEEVMRFSIAARLLAGAVIVMLSGCSTPLPIVDRTTPNGDFPFGDVGSFDKVKAKFKDYYLLYSDEAQSKRVVAQRASETGFYGAIVGVLGGLAKDFDTAATGALVGAGAGLYNDRYRLQVQAANYETAADAMFCMYRASVDISDKNLKHLIFMNQPAEIAIRDIALDGFISVRGKLYKLQASFVLGQPDPNRLKAALNAPQSDPATKKGTQTLASDDATVQALLPDYKNKLDQCFAKISG